MNDLSDIKLSDIAVKIEQSDYNSGNLQSIITEIKYALQRLIEQKKEHSIDLRAMPWSPGEEQKLTELLGLGEVRIELDALGKSTFYETLYSGVWLVTHYNQEDEVIAKLIEITRLPGMVFAQTEDIKNSLEQLSGLSPQRTKDQEDEQENSL